MINFSLDQPKCYFKQEGKCILHRNNCFFCSSFTEKISGMTEAYQYISLISNRKLATKALFISSLSLIIAFLAFILALVKTVIGN